jgi:superfamily I DNA/RNA helicase
MSTATEAATIAAEIKATVGDSGEWSSCAVLARINSAARDIVDGLKAAGIPVAGEATGSAPERWKSAVRLASCAVNPGVPSNIKWVLAWIHGPAEADRLQAEAAKGFGVASSPLRQAATAAEIIETLHRFRRGKALTIPEDTVRAAANIIGDERDPSIALSRIAQAKFAAAQQNGVWVGSIHGSKGLEWPNVWIARAIDGVLPMRRATDPDEEVRIGFVAVTRAARILTISAPRNRQEYPKGPFVAALPSPFIEQMSVA